MIGYLEDMKYKLTTRLAEAISAAGFACGSGAAGGAADAGVQSATGEKPCMDWVQVRLVPAEKRSAHGVFTTNAPLLLAQELGCQSDCEGQSATAVAQAMMNGLCLDDLPVARVEFAQPGFLNFYLVDGWQQRALERILRQSEPLQAEPMYAGAIHTEQMSVAPADAVSTAIMTADRIRQLDFEIWYAYNRICNQLELLAGLGYQVTALDAARLELLCAPQELRLMEHLAAVRCAGSPALSSAQKQARQYLSELAILFHQFFNISPIRGETREIADARICLLQGCRLVYESVLKELFL